MSGTCDLPLFHVCQQAPSSTATLELISSCCKMSAELLLPTLIGWATPSDRTWALSFGYVCCISSLVILLCREIFCENYLTQPTLSPVSGCSSISLVELPAAALHEEAATAGDPVVWTAGMYTGCIGCDADLQALRT